MRKIVIVIVVFLTALAMSPLQSVLAQQEIPFDGLQLVYYSQTTQFMQTEAGVQANAWSTLTFHNVTSTSSNLSIVSNSSYTKNGQQQPTQNLQTTVDFPTNEDTILFLRHGGQDNLTLYAGPTAVTFANLPGVTIDLTRTWTFYDKPIVNTPYGSFNAYRYRAFMNSVQVTNGITVDLTFYASYDQNTQVLMEAEVWASEQGISVMVARTDIKQTNLFSASSSSETQTPSHCLIATATYGSELAPPVQFLRNFRDRQVASTFAGSAFMLMFNAWYYSFSPTVATSIRENTFEQSLMRVFLYPLITSLQFSVNVFSGFGAGSEVGALLAGLIATSLIAMTYLWIPSALLSTKFRVQIRRSAGVALVTLVFSLVGLVVSEILPSPIIASMSSAVILLANMVLVSSFPAFVTRARLVMLGRLRSSIRDAF